VCQNSRVQSATAKSFHLLEAIARGKGPSRLSAVAADLGLSKSTVHRLLAELIDLGYVEQVPATGLYRPTLRTWELGTAVVADLPIKQVASTALQSLHQRTGETVSLTVRSGDDIVYLDKIISPRPIRFTTRVGSRVCAPLTASGKAMLALAHDGPEVVERVAARADIVPPLDVERVLKELVEARRRGYALSRSRPGVVAVAAAVVDRDDEPAAALSVSAPTERTGRAQRADIVEAVLMTATTLAESLGRL
jgi:DNA-binding IclR family transcriptional regulator